MTIPPFYTIEIITPSGETVDMVDDPVSLTAARSYGAVGSAVITLLPDWREDFFAYNMRFRLWRTDSSYNKALFGDTIWFLRKFTHLVSEDRYSIEVADALTLLANPVVAYTAKTPYADKTLEEFALVSYTDYFRIDNLMREYVRENFGADALDGNRVNPLIVVEADRNMAPHGEKEASWAKLDAVLSDLARMSAEKGMELFYDLFPQQDGTFLFKVWKDVRGIDRGFNAAASLIFSDENNDLDDIQVAYDYSTMGTYAYVLGYDNGPSQIVEEVGNSAIIRSDPFGRIEITVNKTESDVSAVLTAEGQAALRALRPRRIVSARLSEATSLRYGTDFAYGDRVGVQINGKQYSCQISAVRAEWQAGRERLDIRLDGSDELWDTAYWEDKNTTPVVIPPPDYIPPEPPPPTTPPDMGLTPTQELVAGIGDDGYVYRTSDFQTASGSGGPTWDRVDLGVTGPIFSWVVDPFSPGYINGSGTIDGWVVNETDIYRVEDLFGTPSATSVHTFATAVDADLGHWRTIQASFGRYFDEGENPWLLCISYYGATSGHTGTYALRSVDGGTTWLGETTVSTEYDYGPKEKDTPIGVYTSPKTPGLAYAVAYLETAFPAQADGFVSGDWGETWTAISAAPVDDPIEQMVAWRRWNGDSSAWVGSAYVSGVGSESFTEASIGGVHSGYSGTMQVAPPADAVRMILRVRWMISFQKVSSPLLSFSFALEDGAAIDHTPAWSTSSPSNPGGTTYDGDDFEFTLVSGVDWPANRDTVAALASPSGLTWRMNITVGSGATESVTCTLALTAKVVEIELDDSTIYTPPVLGDGWLQPENGFAGAIHIPWPDNDDEGIAYYGHLDRFNTVVYKLMQSIAGTQTDISPTDTGVSYGVNHYGFSVRSYDSDRNYMAVGGIGNDAGTDKVGLWVSSNAGAAWANILSPVAATEALYGLQIAFSGTDPDVLYTWGGYSNGSIPAISFSDDFGATLDSREGNVNSLGTVAFIGIAGGPTG